MYNLTKVHSVLRIVLTQRLKKNNLTLSLKNKKVFYRYPGVYIYFAGYHKVYEARYKLQDTVDDYNTWYSFN